MAAGPIRRVKLAHYGEDRLIAELTRALRVDSEVRAGVGDDCAVIGKKRDRLWHLLKTDCLVEGVHFRADEAPQRIGWKALARAISDIAAMGGLPRHALVTVAASGETNVTRLKGIYAGLRKAARAFDVSIVGGETARSPGPLFLSIALTGEVERTRCVMRGGGKPGDILYVTGRLGGSISGRHLTFTPRVPEARWLTENFPLHAMMDLSDGLGADLPRLAKASGTAFELWKENLPRSKGCSVEQALSDGEDYELLFAVAARDAESLETRWRKHFPKLPLTAIGRLCSQSEIRIPQSLHGFDHFA